ncbi:MAG: serine/threonine protein kinase [Planctomycetes bacterium]|nr:serine/threonine protein kinase [Planctomycetota bacterium]
MQDRHHERLRTLFAQCVDLPADARSAFLAEACAGDDALRRRLQAMLAGADDVRFLSEPTGQLPAAVSAAAEQADVAEGPGSRIGPYKLLQQIGEGGFGVVFLAEQTEPVQRRVALKVLKLGMDTRQVVARFEQERQALAMMEHPNIARALDAGATSSGRPYFVMDLVQGQPIVAYCDQNRLPIAERLELFAQVCAAVQHAHGKGVIHRDLKPSNVLVTTIDGRPHAKVIDFGIAKATSQKLTEKTLFTEHQQVIGTLQYMSPEQAAGSLDIDTRTDVYSLGVMLYELLTGSTPFDEKTLGIAMLGELQRLIRDVDPPRPSTRLSAARETIAAIAAQRGVEPRRLGILLRGDLDWIVMRALEKDRVRRYETASDLAADVLRHLRGEAVVAAPPSAGYRLRKFVRRNRALVLASAATGAALLAGVVAFAWQANVAARERDRAVTMQQTADVQRRLAEDHARAEAAARRRAEAITAFVTQTLRSADPVHGGQQNTSIVDAMQKAVRMIDRGVLRDQPQVTADVLETIAEVLADHGRADEALPLAERALVLTRTRHRGPHVDTARSLRTLGYVKSQLGRHEEALAVNQEVLAMLQQVPDPVDDALCTAQNNIATMLAHLGRFAEAEPIMRQALATTVRLVGPDSVEVATSKGTLGGILEHLGQIEAAEALFREARNTLQQLPGDHPSKVSNSCSLGHLLWSTGRAAEAEPLFAEALAENRRMFAGDHPVTTKCLANLAAAHEAQGQFEAAEPLLREAVRMSQAVFPGDHPLTAELLEALADLHCSQKREAEALPPLEQAVGMRRRLGMDEALAHDLFNLGKLLFDLRRDAEAEPVLVEAVDHGRHHHGGDHEALVSLLILLGRARLALDKPIDAQPALDEALAMHARLQPGPSKVMARLQWFAARTRLQNGEPARALPGLEAAVTMAESLLPADSPQLAEYRATLAKCRAALAK